MANPLDALRVTVIFDVEHAAFAGLDGGGLVAWWLAHGWAWLALVVAAVDHRRLHHRTRRPRRRLDADIALTLRRLNFDA